MKRLVAILLFSMTNLCVANNVVNIFNWADYIPTEVIQQFEQQTGITVNFSEFTSNASLYTKLKSDPKNRYDVIFPSTYYVSRMREEHMLHRLDYSKLTYSHYLDKKLLNKSFDPHNLYSLPYLWGTTGIVINTRYIKQSSITYWSDFWKPRYKNQLLLLNEMREDFAIALLSLGYSINDTNPKHIRKAFFHLKKLLPNVRLFNSDTVKSIYADGDVRIGMAWSGDAYLSQHANKSLTYIFPKDGFTIWIDCMAIPKSAPHLENAYRFINFLMQPKIAAKIAKIEGYSTPNTGAYAFLPTEWRTNPMLNPSPELLKRGQFQLGLGAANKIYLKYWQLLKLGG